MKKLLIYTWLPCLLAMFMSAAFVSCSDDDDSNSIFSGGSNSLIGTWQWGKISADSEASYYIFNEDGTGVEIIFGGWNDEGNFRYWYKNYQEYVDNIYHCYFNWEYNSKNSILTFSDNRELNKIHGGQNNFDDENSEWEVKFSGKNMTLTSTYYNDDPYAEEYERGYDVQKYKKISKTYDELLKEFEEIAKGLYE